jgi:hypothetical protein
MELILNFFKTPLIFKNLQKQKNKLFLNIFSADAVGSDNIIIKKKNIFHLGHEKAAQKRDFVLKHCNKREAIAYFCVLLQLRFQKQRLRILP